MESLIIFGMIGIGILLLIFILITLTNIAQALTAILDQGVLTFKQYGEWYEEIIDALYKEPNSKTSLVPEEEEETDPDEIIRKGSDLFDRLQSKDFEK